jgi:hypothetical protein
MCYYPNFYLADRVNKVGQRDYHIDLSVLLACIKSISQAYRVVQPDSTPASPFTSEYADPDSHASKAVPYPERPFYPERHAPAAVPNSGRHAPAAPAPSPERPAPTKVSQKRVLAQSLQAKKCSARKCW